MKTTMITILVMGVLTQSFAQDVLMRAKVKKEDVPVTIIEEVEDVFPDYQMDEFYAIPINFVEEDLIIEELAPTNKDYYDTYEVVLKNNHHLLKAIYSRNGNLRYTKETGKNVTPPPAVRNTIAKEYPGWTLTSDAFKIIHSKGKLKKERYALVLEKGRNRIKVYTDAEGHIL